MKTTDRIHRINILKVLIKSFQLYQNMRDFLFMLENPINSSEAENLCNIANALFDKETYPSELMIDEDTCDDEILDANMEFNRFIGRQKILPPELIKTFCKRLYDVDDGITIASLSVLFLPTFLDKIKFCLKGKISFDTMRNGIGMPHITKNGIVIIPSSTYFRLMVERIEEELEICKRIKN